MDEGAAAAEAYRVARQRARQAEERFFHAGKDDLSAAHAAYIRALREELEARARLAELRAARQAQAGSTWGDTATG